MPEAILPPYDPYEPKPSWLQRHIEPVSAVTVFLLTVFLAVISFPPFKTPEFAYVMLAPGAFWAYTRPRFKVFVWTIFSAQAVAWTILLSWLHHVTWGGLLLLGPFVGIWVGLWYLAAYWTMPRMLGRPTPVRLFALLGLAGVWVLIEWTRTWFLGGFPWLPLAASQWTMVSMLQVMSYTGATGLSFVIVAVNLGFAAYAHRLLREGLTGLNKRSQEFFLALFLVLACFSIHVQQSFNRAYYAEPVGKVAFVQPYIPQTIKWDPAKDVEIVGILEKTTLAAATTRPDLLMWPESATPWAVQGDPQVKAFVENLARRADAPLLLGSIADKGDKSYNGAFVVSPQTGLQPDYYAKRKLVPFGEYVPFRPLLGWIGKFVELPGDFSPGEDTSPLMVLLRSGPLAVGPLICYEDIYPSLARSATASGASVLAVLTNNGWFGEGGAAYQHAAHSVLRAVENRRPVLRCGNGGWSGWIDEYGAIRNVVENKDGTIYFRGSGAIEMKRDVRWKDRESFYTQYGEWFVALAGVLALFAFSLLKITVVAPPKP